MQTSNHQEQYTVALTRSVALDSTGKVLIYTDDLAQAITRNGPSGQADTVTLGPDEFGRRFRQTMTFDANGAVVGISAWVQLPGV